MPRLSGLTGVRREGTETDYKESNPFYHRKAWKRVRLAALQRDRWMCRDCMERFDAGYGFKPNRATMVHHVIPLEERPDLALDLDNLRSLCDECHNRRHPEKGQPRKKETPAGGVKLRVIRV